MRKIQLLTFMILVFASSCGKKKTVCNEKTTIQAIKTSLIQIVKDQSKYITEEYGIENVEKIADEIFNENLIISDLYLQGDILQSDEYIELCTCGSNITFRNNDEFIEHIKPLAENLDEIDDKYSSQYLRDEHLLKFYKNKKYSFFVVLEKNDTVIKISPIDYKVESLLIDYLLFTQSH